MCHSKCGMELMPRGDHSPGALPSQVTSVPDGPPGRESRAILGEVQGNEYVCVATRTAVSFTTVHCKIEGRGSILPGPDVLERNKSRQAEQASWSCGCESSSLRTSEVRKSTLLTCLGHVLLAVISLEKDKNMDFTVPLHVGSIPSCFTVWK